MLDYFRSAGAAGENAGREYGPFIGPELKNRLQQLWSEWFARRPAGGIDWNAYREAMGSFIEGFRRGSGAGVPHDWLLIPTKRSLGVVITAMNEEETLPSIIGQLYRMPLAEAVFVVNGSTDRSYSLIRNLSPAVIVHYPHPLGHDVGRVIGAKMTKAETVLFLDGDFPVFAEHLLPFIEAIERGVDLALNNISPYIGLFASRDGVTIVKQFVNRALGREDLAAASMTAVPHALSRRALDAIGPSALATPPKAQAMVLGQGLKVECPGSVDVITPNRIRTINAGTRNVVSEMIIGDHLEAMHWTMAGRGKRLGFEDRLRRRNYAEGSV